MIPKAEKESHVRNAIMLDLSDDERKKHLDAIFNFVSFLRQDSTRCAWCGFPKRYHIEGTRKFLGIFKIPEFVCPEID